VVSVLDSVVLGPAFTSERMAAVFADVAFLRAVLDVEVALAEAEAALGLIPEAAASDIARAAADDIPPELVRDRAQERAHLLVPVIEELERRCSGPGAPFVHWGVTTQDVVDTAHAIQLREAHRIICERLDGLLEQIAFLADAEAETAMVARTHGQHALPTTFGCKVAGWYWELWRDYQRWEAAGARLTAGSIAGAVGTYASLGAHGRAVEEAVLARLGLPVAESPWHAARDRPAEMGAIAAIIAGSCERLASEIHRLQGTEYGELAEPSWAGRVGSSTMPQKRNPMTCEAIITCARCARVEALTLLAAMPQAHERDSASWKTEWYALPHLLVLLDSALEKASKVITGLHVDRDRMAANLGLTRGTILAEPVFLSLAPILGRSRAHALVARTAQRAEEERQNFRDALADDPDIAASLSGPELERLCDPLAYLGEAPSLAREPLRHRRDLSTTRSQYHAGSGG